MYLWNVKALAHDLKESKLTEKEKFKYFYGFILLNFVPLPNTVTSTESIGWAVIYAWGLYACFKANQRGDNINFVERIICLALPLMIRLAAYAFPVGIVVYLLSKILGLHDTSIEWVYNYGSLGFGIVCFWLIRRWILYISGETDK